MGCMRLESVGPRWRTRVCFGFDNLDISMSMGWGCLAYQFKLQGTRCVRMRVCVRKYWELRDVLMVFKSS